MNLSISQGSYGVGSLIITDDEQNIWGFGFQSYQHSPDQD
jgi:hypothetical protein